MSAVAVQPAPFALHQSFQPRHAAAPPASLAAAVERPGIITLSKPIQRTPPRQRKATPSAPAPNATPKSEKTRKPRSRPTSDEDDQESPKARGRRPQEKTPSPKRRPQSRTRQTPSPESEPVLQKPSGRLAKQRKTKSTPALCAAVAGSAPVPVPQVSSAPTSSGLSRSAPMATPMSQSLPARMRRTLTGPRDDPAPKDVPASPSPRRVRESKGPLTAPLAGVFPRPTHSRSPSEALFNLSLDETDDEPQDMPILFGRRGGDKVYAGGRFQNGPDTTTLPAPSFLSGF